MKKLLGIAAIAALAGTAHGQVVISEILGSTSGADWEYIELANMGAATVDISGYELELWESTTTNGSGYPQLDGASPYVVPGGTSLGPHETFVWGNGAVVLGYPDPPYHIDVLFGDNSVENSSYTAVLTSSTNGPIVDSWYVTQAGPDDVANRNGVPIVPNFTIGPDGSFLPAGAYRDLNGLHLLNFSTTDLANGTLAGGTPGIYQIPTPGAFALVGLGGLLATRRRRA